MTVDDQTRDEKYNTILTEKLTKYLLCRQTILINYFPAEKILPSNEKQMIQQTNFTYSRLGKAFEKQIKKLKIKEKSKYKQFKIKDKLKQLKI